MGFINASNSMWVGEEGKSGVRRGFGFFADLLQDEAFNVLAGTLNLVNVAITNNTGNVTGNLGGAITATGASINLWGCYISDNSGKFQFPSYSPSIPFPIWSYFFITGYGQIYMNGGEIQISRTTIYGSSEQLIVCSSCVINVTSSFMGGNTLCVETLGSGILPSMLSSLLLSLSHSLFCFIFLIYHRKH